MNKFIIILLLMPFICNAQLKQDKINHFTAGYIAGFTGSGISYNLLANNTNLKLRTCKLLSLGIGAGLGVLAGHLKEQYDMKNDSFYNKSDLQYTGAGAIMGAITIKIIIGKSIPEKRYFDR